MVADRLLLEISIRVINMTTTVEDYNKFRSQYYDDGADVPLASPEFVMLEDWSIRHHLEPEIIFSILALAKEVGYKIEKFTVEEILENHRNGFSDYTEKILILSAWVYLD